MACSEFFLAIPKTFNRSDFSKEKRKRNYQNLEVILYAIAKP